MADIIDNILVTNNNGWWEVRNHIDDIDEYVKKQDNRLLFYNPVTKEICIAKEYYDFEELKEDFTIESDKSVTIDIPTEWTLWNSDNNYWIKYKQKK